MKYVLTVQKAQLAALQKMHNNTKVSAAMLIAVQQYSSRDYFENLTWLKNLLQKKGKNGLQIPKSVIN